MFAGSANSVFASVFWSNLNGGITGVVTGRTFVYIVVLTTKISITIRASALRRIDSMGLSSTFVTIVKNCVTFCTPDITRFANHFVLSIGLEMMTLTRTLRCRLSMRSTLSTISIRVTFFTFIITFRTSFLTSVIMEVRTGTLRRVNSITSTGDT